jgi:hypothetical protein
VNIYLFHADSLEPVLAINDYINPTDRAGVIRANVNDTWWGEWIQMVARQKHFLSFLLGHHSDRRDIEQLRATSIHFHRHP